MSNTPLAGKTLRWRVEDVRRLRLRLAAPKRAAIAESIRLLFAYFFFCMW